MCKVLDYIIGYKRITHSPCANAGGQIGDGIFPVLECAGQRPAIVKNHVIALDYHKTGVAVIEGPCQKVNGHGVG